MISPYTLYHIIKSNKISFSCFLHIGMKENIKNAASYIARYWTNPEFYRVCTHHIFDPISILHLPAEKGCGILVMYKYLKRRNTLPSTSLAFKILNLPRTPTKLKVLFVRIKRFIIRKFFI